MELGRLRHRTKLSQGRGTGEMRGDCREHAGPDSPGGQQHPATVTEPQPEALTLSTSARVQITVTWPMLNDDLAPHYPVCYHSGESRPRLDRSSRKALYGQHETMLNRDSARGAESLCTEAVHLPGIFRPSGRSWGTQYK